eukprot:9475505-Pyramimonas_sp.AAC.1
MLGEIVTEDSESALQFLKAEFDSDDRPDSLPQEAYIAFIPLAMPSDATGAAEEAEAKILKNNRGTATLGSPAFWRKRSH